MTDDVSVGSLMKRAGASEGSFFNALRRRRQRNSSFTIIPAEIPLPAEMISCLPKDWYKPETFWEFTYSITSS